MPGLRSGGGWTGTWADEEGRKFGLYDALPPSNGKRSLGRGYDRSIRDAGPAAKRLPLYG